MANTKKLSDILSDRLNKISGTPVYAKHEWQDFGVRVAKELDDEKRTSMYIKFAKEYGQEILEESLDFVKESKNVKSKTKLFLWKFKQLRENSRFKEAIKDENF